MSEKVYVAVGSRSWSQETFARLMCLPGTWHFFTEASELSHEALRTLQPRYVFFLHWSHKVAEPITSSFECVCFHMTDLPYGRGGSPLQNLIQRGHQDTKISALRMTQDLDAGPIYLKCDLSLAGSAEEIYRRAMVETVGLIEKIIAENPQPTAQVGLVVNFKRRKPEQSRIEDIAKLDSLYDFIRMLDAEGYPRAYLDHGPFRVTFSSAKKEPNKVIAQVEIVLRSEEQI